MASRSSGNKRPVGPRRRRSRWWGRLDPWRVAAGVFVGLIVASLLLAAIGPAAFERSGAGREGDGTTSDGSEFEAELRRRVEERPDDPQAAVGLANLLTLEDRGEEAVDLYERAVALDPENGRYRLDFATTLVDLGRAADAEVQFRRALAINAGDAGARLGLASLLERADPVRRGEAVAEYRRLVAEEAGSYYAEEAGQGLARLGAASAGATPAASPAGAAMGGGGPWV